MSKELDELELLREQNELLKKQLELQEKNKKLNEEKEEILEERREYYRNENNHNNRSGQNFSITNVLALLIIIGFVIGVVYFITNKDDDSPNVSNTSNYHNNTSTEKQCVRWENTYNFDWCKYTMSSGCEVTGQKCVEWK